MTRILVVDDEPQLRKALAINLRARDYEVVTASTGEEALLLATQQPPDLVVLDLGLPGIDGIEVIEALRCWTQVPIVVLSVREGEADKVAALDAGADDYVTKPFSMGELLARVRAGVRRQAPFNQSSSVSTTHFDIDFAQKRITIDGQEIRLTPIEWGLVDALARNPDRLVTQRELLQKVWGPTYENESNYLRVHMAHLRRKLEPVPSQPRYFITEPGMGYRFQLESAD